MQKKLRFVSLLLALGLTLGVAACAKDEGSAPPVNAPGTDAVLPELPESDTALPDTPEPETPQPEEPEEPEEPAAAFTQYLEVNTDGLNVRTGPGTSYASLGQADQHTLLANLGKSGNWYKTYYRNRTAYVSAAHVTVLEMEEGDHRLEQVIEEGLKLLGTVYVYGAIRLHDGNGKLNKNFSVNAFDCSSLMQYMFYHGADVLLKLTTRTQVTQGRYVSKANLQRGDLLFFTNSSRYNNTGVERIGHVALYLGDNYILHTASDFAKIEQISAKRWSYFIEARRMF